MYMDMPAMHATPYAPQASYFNNYSPMHTSQAPARTTMNAPSPSNVSTPSSFTLIEEEQLRLGAQVANLGKSCLEEVVNPWLSGVITPQSPLRETPLAGRNPNAAPFLPGSYATAYVPFITRKRAREDPINCGIEHIWPRNHPWIAHFRAGSLALEENVRIKFAKNVVESSQWDTSIISELAGKICERSIETHSMEPFPTLAPFAREIYKRFEVELGDIPASHLQNQLALCILSEFRALWLPKHETSIPNIPSCSPSPPHSPPIQLVASAIGLSAFVGDLFVQGLITARFVDLCLKILVENLTIIEQVHAVHAILSHADSRLYEGMRMKDFLDVLDSNAMKMYENASVAGQPFTREQLYTYIQSIFDIVAAWAQVANTPALTEPSPAPTLVSDFTPEGKTIVEPPPPPTSNQLPPSTLPTQETLFVQNEVQQALAEGNLLAHALPRPSTAVPSVSQLPLAPIVQETPSLSSSVEVTRASVDTLRPTPVRDSVRAQADTPKVLPSPSYDHDRTPMQSVVHQAPRPTVTPRPSTVTPKATPTPIPAASPAKPRRWADVVKAS